MTKTIRLYSWNVNGIRAVINKGLFASFIKSENPDILCLQETKAERAAWSAYFGEKVATPSKYGNEWAGKYQKYP